MALISVTRLHLRSWRFFPVFLFHTLRSAGQAKRAAGFLDGALGTDGDGGFWTVTVWRDEHAMRAYRTSGAHLKAMPHLLHWCDEAAVAHWSQETGELPDAARAFARMRDEGRPSKVHHPSARHTDGRTVGGAALRYNRRLAPGRSNASAGV